MSSNFYEDPDLMMKTRYSRGVREEREERVEKRVDIYDSIATVTGRQDDQVTPDSSPAVQTHLPKGAALVLAVLCVLLFMGLSVLFSLYVTLESENNQLLTQIKNLKNSTDDPANTYCSDGEQPEGGATRWQIFECSCYYVSTERKNWTDSRTDCLRRGADLVLIKTKDKQDVVRRLSGHRDSWIGLQTVKTSQWSEGWTWAWVDGTPATYLAWHKDVTTNPQSARKAFVVPGGTWKHSDAGTKHWICEKKMKWELHGEEPGFHGD